MCASGGGGVKKSPRFLLRMDLRMSPPGSRDLRVEDIPRAQGEAVEELPRSGVV